MTNIQLNGNVTKAPELRYTPNGKAVVNFNVAVNRTKNVNGECVADGTDFYTCEAWDKFAENIAESLTKGTNVLVNGILKQQQYETEAGEKRVSYKITAEDMGPSLKFKSYRTEISKNHQSSNFFGENESPKTVSDLNKPESVLGENSF